MEVAINIKKLKDGKWDLTAAYGGFFLRHTIKDDDNPFLYRAYFHTFHKSQVLSFQKDGQVVKSIRGSR